MNYSNTVIKPILPSKEELSFLLHSLIDILLNEDEGYRPWYKREVGSLLEFSDSLPVIIIPDLHARFYFLLSLLDYKIEGETISFLLEQEKIRLVFLGDGLHTEAMQKERWIKAYEAFLRGSLTNPFIEEEMAEGLSLMTEVMRLKITYPALVHFLKGNHENILNEESYGNRPFRKIVMEGEMVKAFMLSYYGKELTELYASFEFLLPLFVIGEGFLMSHAEPAKAYSKKELIEAKKHPSLIHGLTWTKNDEVSGQAVIKLLKKFQRAYPHARYYVGHRPVEERLAYRAGGKLVQIHDANLNQFVYLKPGELFDDKKNILVIE